jgi:hypothetical protein
MDESAREKKKRLQKGQELADAEEQIEQLRRDLRFLEEALENGSKRPVPARSPSDSPQSPDNKRTNLEEPVQNAQTAEAQTELIQTSKSQAPSLVVQTSSIPGQVELARSNPTVSAEQVQTESVQTPITKIIVTESIQTPITQTKVAESVQTPITEDKVAESVQTPITQDIVAESVQTPNTQSMAPENAQTPITQSIIPESVQTGIAPSSAEESAKTREAQSQMIENFERQRDERLEKMDEQDDDFRFDSQGDIVDVTSSRSQSAQIGSLVFSQRSSSKSSERDPKERRSLDPEGGCQRDHRGRNRTISAAEEYKTPRSNHYTEAEYDQQALEAWRHHCRQSHDYMPDRACSDDVHAKHLRVSQAAIKDFKIERENQRLQGEVLVEFDHARYSHLQQQYHIPKGIRSEKALIDGLFQEELKRAATISMPTAVSLLQHAVGGHARVRCEHLELEIS